MLVKNEIELPVAKRAEIAHVAAYERERRSSLPCEPSHGVELTRTDVEERGVRAELGEENGVPAAAARER